MSPNLEAITKAAHSADLLVRDLREVFQSTNPLLSEMAVGEIELAAAMQRRLERMKDAVERLEVQS